MRGGIIGGLLILVSLFFSMRTPLQAQVNGSGRIRTYHGDRTLTTRIVNTIVGQEGSLIVLALGEYVTRKDEIEFLIIAGEIAQITADEIQLKNRDGSTDFVISDNTVFCSNGAKMDKRNISVGDTICIKTIYGKSTALSVRKGPMIFIPRSSGLSLKYFDCGVGKNSPQKMIGNSEQTIGERSSKQIRGIQQKLKDLGYDPGSIDGRMGPRTRKAIQDFQRDQGYTITGDPTDELLKQLEKAVSL